VKKEGKLFFFGKKEAKNFFDLGLRWFRGRWPNYKSFFCFFFVHKKEEAFLEISFALIVDSSV